MNKKIGFRRLTLSISIVSGLIAGFTAYYRIWYLESALLWGAIFAGGTWGIYGLTLFVVKGFRKE
jgi:hypothetical protein